MKKIKVLTTIIFLALAACSNAAISDFSITRDDIIFDSNMSLNPSTVKASNGDLVACFSETGDGFAPGRLQFVRSTDNGLNWDTTPYLIMTSTHGDFGSLGGYLSRSPNGDIVLALMDILAVGGHENFTSDLKVYTSTDNGLTFPEANAVTIPTLATELEPLSVDIIFLSNGDWILPGYVRTASPPYNVPCGFWRSTDDGATWGTIETAFADELPGDPNYKAFNEVSIVQRSDDSLLAVARTDADSSGFPYSDGQLYYCESFNNGSTWTTPQLMGIPGHSPALIVWPDGVVMLGCRRLSGSGNWTSVYIAEDGTNFQFAFNTVEPRPNRTSGTGYPTFAKLTNNDIYISFYAGDSTLPWDAKTYCAGNMIYYDKIFTFSCGDFGYLLADLNEDCRVDFKDLAVVAENWLLSTNPDALDYVDCSEPTTDPRCADN